ncbi:MAG: NAD-dependent epimerase/dehydratase family protein [Thermaceae bacterium]|nr:NAD-dependent epimerase/dehydratase family protein [Thermaceae bacterium]
MQKILVLGGAGFIGFHLSKRLVAEGHQVVLVDDFSRGQADPELRTLIAHPQVSLIQADLTDPNSYAQFPRDCHQIYMLAAVVGVRNVEKDPFRVVRVNTLAVMHLLDWIPPGCKLFFASTSEAYAGAFMAGIAHIPTAEDVPLVIQDVTSPRFTYGASKLLGEVAVIHAAKAKGFGYVVGRFHNVYGPRMGADHVIPELSLRAMRRENPFRVYGTDQSRAFCYIDDATQAMSLLMAHAEADNQIVHIGNDTEETNIGDLTELVLKVANFHPSLDRQPAPSGAVNRRCPDIGKLRGLTGFEPKVSLEQGVRQTFEWYQQWFAAQKV